MKLREEFELLGSLFVELDPLEDGFAGVLLEVYRRGDRYVLAGDGAYHGYPAPQVLFRRQGAGLRRTGAGAWCSSWVNAEDSFHLSKGKGLRRKVFGA